jgi:hypothetical protein
MNLPAQKKASNSLGMTFDQMFRMAEMVAKSDLAPKDYKGKVENCFIAIQMGQEIGLAPLQAIQSIAVINGKPCIYGDAAIALVLASPFCEDVIEVLSTDGTAYSCTAIRKGHKPHTKSFSIEDAKKAGLWGKAGPWTNYGPRMLQMRARGFALRDKFSDVLKGLSLVEEVMDIQGEKDITPSTDVTQPATQIDKLKANLKIAPPPADEPIANDFDFNAELEKLKTIETVDSLVDTCKWIAGKIIDIEQRKNLEKVFKERKTHLDEI